eukprot:230376-Prorocentrum_minimum.AAC.1
MPRVLSSQPISGCHYVERFNQSQDAASSQPILACYVYPLKQSQDAACIFTSSYVALPYVRVLSFILHLLHASGLAGVTHRPPPRPPCRSRWRTAAPARPACGSTRAAARRSSTAPATNTAPAAAPPPPPRHPRVEPRGSPPRGRGRTGRTPPRGTAPEARLSGGGWGC